VKTAISDTGFSKCMRNICSQNVNRLMVSCGGGGGGGVAATAAVVMVLMVVVVVMAVAVTVVVDFWICMLVLMLTLDVGACVGVGTESWVPVFQRILLITEC
jgi:hypothetical protein